MIRFTTFFGGLKKVLISDPVYPNYIRNVPKRLQWQADLVDISRLKQANNEITFLLTVIDVFSKRAWCVPLKNKSAAALVMAFRQLLSNSNNIAPTTLQTDKGSEFLNRPLQRLLKEYGVHHFTTHNEDTKASIVERFNRTLKTRMWRYFTKNQTLRYVEVLQDFVRSYNDTFFFTPIIGVLVWLHQR